ncbi:response regulator [Candidatus Nitronereus thalassa]|uniref:Response regulator n=1 Tax=Candidatus Nitronereus thalassa TaxID=3020898 RepID=A0ABU3K9H0_9BACT|nr:response regulator [Candidatus Nitronereus thalassa]MDT7043035.1 response regulator [Candidatus Nitronereus thalassa]
MVTEHSSTQQPQGHTNADGSDSGKSSAPQNAPRSSAIFSGSKTLGTVLVVDDEPDVRKVIRMTLEKSGYHVIEAEDGDQAIKVLNAGENPILVDTIITDIRMPKINGVEAINYFQQQYPSMPLVVLTGYPDLDMATSFMTSGIVDYLVKPVEKEKLKATVAKAIEQRQISFM